MLAKFYFFAFFLIIIFNLNAQNLDYEGDWYGILDAGVTKIPLVFHLKKENGVWTGSMDSPEQQAMGIGFKTVEINQKRITITLKDINASFVGDWDEETKTISGTWQQGQAFNLDLSRQIIKKEKLNRPQEPTVFDYEQQEVEIYNPKAKTKLAGTLSYPKNGQNLPAILLLSGSGSQDRDCNIFGHKSFLLIADLLTKNGFAVLRMDDRGVGRSEDSQKPTVIADLVQDAAACVKWLRAQKRINPAKIGLIGHSQGGVVAPMLAAKDRKIAFVLMMAGLGLDGKTVIGQQTEDIMYASGASAETCKKVKAVNLAIFDLTIAKKAKQVKLPELQKLINDNFADMPAEERQILGVGEERLKEILPMLNNPSFRSLLNTRPADYLPQVKCPVLAINGGKDVQVKAAPNLAAIQILLEKGKNPDFSCQLLPSLNHLFQTCQTGGIEEYQLIEETFAPEALDVILQWVKKW